MGLPFGKKKAKVQGEKKDLKQNYTTEDHKTDLADLLRTLNSDATKVGTAVQGARRGGGGVEGPRHAGVAWLCLRDRARSDCAIRLLALLLLVLFVLQFFEHVSKTRARVEATANRSFAELEYSSDAAPRPRLRSNFPQVVVLLIPAAGLEHPRRIRICSPQSSCVSVSTLVSPLCQKNYVLLYLDAGQVPARNKRLFCSFANKHPHSSRSLRRER